MKVREWFGWRRLPTGLVFLLAAVLGIRHLREPDLWWQLRTGEWILEHGTVPTVDVFSYTYAGTPWVNIKWGFEVLLALLAGALGEEAMLLWQVVMNVLLWGMVWKLANVWQDQEEAEGLWRSVGALGGLLMLSGLAYRMNGRPEMVSHGMVVAFVWLLERARKHNGKGLAWLIFLQMCWVNLHEAFALGLVVSGVYWVGAVWLTWRKQPDLDWKKLGWVLLLQVAMVFVNPYGLQMLLKPAEIFGQLMSNKFTTELLDWRSVEFWQYEAYLLIAGWGVLCWLVVGLWKQSGKSFRDYIRTLGKELGLGYMCLLLVFSGLGFTAYRNLVFPLLLMAPLWMLLGYRVLAVRLKKVRAEWMVVLVCGLLVLAYGAVVSGKYYEWRGGRDRYGFGVWRLNNPVGAAEFLRSNGLSDQRIFSDYLTSSYLLWRLQPEFKTFIDLRDLDVFPESFFGVFSEAVAMPEAFDRLNQQYGFEVVVLFRPQFGALHRHLYASSEYRMVFADAVAVVYCRDSLVKNKGFTIHDQAFVSESFPVEWMNRVFNPFYSEKESDVADQEAAAISYFLSAGDLDQAGVAAAKGLRAHSQSATVLDACGQYYFQRGLQQKDSSRLDWLMQAGRFFEQAIQQDAGGVSAYLGRAAVLMQMGRYADAVGVLELGMEQDDTQLQLYLFASEAYKVLANQQPQNQGYARALLSALVRANRLNPNNPVLEMNLGFAYFRNGDCSKATPLFEKSLTFEGIPEAERKAARQCLEQCSRR